VTFYDGRNPEKRNVSQDGKQNRKDDEGRNPGNGRMFSKTETKIPEMEILPKTEIKIPNDEGRNPGNGSMSAKFEEKYCQVQNRLVQVKQAASPKKIKAVVLSQI